ncbi:unnamed protein product [Heligmosomoides polygyrus]|uniref:Pre-mRNA-splicing factor CWC25 homolog n=1 Tax=Heligmosomoides polygyrus TaxID=6339 RepID=A0A183F7E0_HELPZ|nr:unnamed protein product [Heligmosomoides polygyrus]
MTHDKKKSKKEHKRSKSREKHSHKKSKKRARSSSSSSSSDSGGDSRFQSVLDEQRAEKRRLRLLEKEKMKAKETPEEKRARRLAKKLKKEEKKKKETQSCLPPQLAYTNLNNPFNDLNLTETFVWGKKLEREGKAGLSRKQIEKEMRSRIEKNLREMEELKRTRDARLAAREDMEMMQRDADRKAHAQWTSKEAEFQLQQAKVNLFGQS